MSEDISIMEDSVNKAFADIFTSNAELKNEMEEISELCDEEEEILLDIEEYLSHKADTYLQERIQKLMENTDSDKHEWGIFWEIDSSRDLFDGLCVFLLEALKQKRPIVYLIQDVTLWRSALNSLFVDFGIQTERAPLPNNMPDSPTIETIYDIRDFLEAVTDIFSPWYEFISNPYSQITSTGMNKYEKDWLSKTDTEIPLGLCIPSKPPSSEEDEDKLWDVLANIGDKQPVQWVVGCIGD